MDSNKLGSDPEALERLARLCVQTASSINNARTRVDSKLQELFWQGPDAEAFKQSWSSTSGPHLQRVTRQLGAAAADLRTEARRQRQVSSA